MIVNQGKPFDYGFTSITQQHGKHSEMLLDFGILKLNTGDMESSSTGRERAWLLIRGSATFAWEGKTETVRRSSCFDEAPYVLHVPRDTEVTVKTDSECEICVEQVDNDTVFEAKLYRPEDIRTDIFGAGTLNETSIRSVRTVFDGEINPMSNMVLGEVINHPGKSSRWIHQSFSVTLNWLCKPWALSFEKEIIHLPTIKKSRPSGHNGVWKLIGCMQQKWMEMIIHRCGFWA
jgi:5-deoxy-glucuronate isomerase